MENKRGSGIFLGVVSIATLIVAIIGATFAYFSATVSSDNSSVTATAYQISATMTITPVAAPTGLIPLNESDIDGALTAVTDGEHDHGICEDEKGYAVCQLYKVTINNSGASPLTLTGSIVQESNDGFVNLYYQGVDATEGESVTYAKSATAASKLSYMHESVYGTTESPIVDATEPTAVTIATDFEVPANSEESVYVLLYIKNDDNVNQSVEMGKTFVGTITFTTESGSNKLSGSFTAA